MFRNKNIENIISKRTSIRNYSKENFDKSLIVEIQEIINQQISTPFNNKPVFFLVDKKEFEEKKIKLGTYGFISGARYFIVGKIEKNQNCFVDYGYALEKIILDFTEKELGTCWLGGSFKKENFKKTIEISEKEIIPAITPLGIPADKRSVKEKIIRKIASSKKRKSCRELFFFENFETPLSKNTKLEFIKALEMVRIAPSSENFQPWRIILTGNNNFHFLLKRSKMIKNTFSTDLQQIDIGIAMLHFEITLNSYGYEIEWSNNEDFILEIDSKLEYICTAKIV